jgi:hypothetical protein
MLETLSGGHQDLIRRNWTLPMLRACRCGALESAPGTRQDDAAGFEQLQ